MKLLTVKDFIAYNNPCFSCGDNINLDIVTVTIEDPHDNNKPISSGTIKPTVHFDKTTFSLQTTYNNTLTICVFHKTNKFAVTHLKDLEKYLKSHKIYLSSRCNKCNTFIESFNLEFNLEHQYIKPTKINKEYLSVTDSINRYILRSDVFTSSTRVLISSLESGKSLAFDLPLYLLSKFKTREKLLSKLKIYLTLS